MVSLTMTQALAMLFISATNSFNLPPGLIESVCWVESKYNVEAIHKDDGGTDSLGVCQVKLKTAQWLGYTGTQAQLMKPRTNIYYSAKYLAYQIKRYRQTETAVVAYNRGHAGDLSTTEYSQKVMQRWGMDEL